MKGCNESQDVPEIEERASMVLSTIEKIEQQKKASRLFSPRTPISKQDLFAGRSSQIIKMIEAINQPGAHAIIYGERGVGKTSLANVAPLSFALEEKKPIVAPRINCDGTDDYRRLWRKVFGEIKVTTSDPTMGFKAGNREETHYLSDEVENRRITPGVVQNLLSEFGQHCHLVIILDEFDRLPGGHVARLIADTIKSLSDSVAPATLVLVGVGDSVSALIRGHESVRRHLIEVPLPRMSKEELEKIVADRVPKLGLSIDDSALRLITLLSRGLPYYTHLLGQHSACLAIDVDGPVIKKGHVQSAMDAAIEDSEREMRRVYYEATKSRQPGCLYGKSLAACAMAHKDEFGYFTAADVRQPMSQIMGRKYEISNFVLHLDHFCDGSKGKILQTGGTKHGRRYRFSDPLMEPFVVIKSLATDIISIEHLKAISTQESNTADTS